jgi:hypothetical protein
MSEEELCIVEGRQGDGWSVLFRGQAMTRARCDYWIGIVRSMKGIGHDDPEFYRIVPAPTKHKKGHRP